MLFFSSLADMYFQTSCRALYRKRYICTLVAGYGAVVNFPDILLTPHVPSYF